MQFRQLVPQQGVHIRETRVLDDGLLRCRLAVWQAAVPDESEAGKETRLEELGEPALPCMCRVLHQTAACIFCVLAQAVAAHL